MENVSFDVDPPDPKNINWVRLKKRLARDVPDLTIVWRDEWGAVPPREKVPLDVPAKIVTMLYTETDPCKTDDICVQRVKSIQEDHMARGLPDLPWNFMVGGNGKVYEGRGFNVEGADKTGLFAQYNKKSFDIAYIAKERDEVTRHMKFIKGQLIRFGLLEWFIDSPFGFAEDKYDWEVMAKEKKRKDDLAEEMWKKRHKSSSSSSTELSSFWSTTDEDGVADKPKVKKRRKRKKKSKKSSSESEYPLGIPVRIVGNKKQCEQYTDHGHDPFEDD